MRKEKRRNNIFCPPPAGWQETAKKSSSLLCYYYIRTVYPTFHGIFLSFFLISFFFLLLLLSFGLYLIIMSFRSCFIDELQCVQTRRGDQKTPSGVLFVIYSRAHSVERKRKRKTQAPKLPKAQTGRRRVPFVRLVHHFLSKRRSLRVSSTTPSTTTTTTLMRTLFLLFCPPFNGSQSIERWVIHVQHQEEEEEDNNKKKRNMHMTSQPNTRNKLRKSSDIGPAYI